MCLVCGCGDMYQMNGQPLAMTYPRLALIASRLGITPLAVAENILGTVLGEITRSRPREDDDRVTFKLIKQPRVKRDARRTGPGPTEPTRRHLSRRTKAGRERAAERQNQSIGEDDIGPGTPPSLREVRPQAE